MALLPLISARDTTGPLEATLAAISAARGRDFNIYRLLANSPVALDGMYSLAEAMWSGSVIERELQELVILRVAQLTGSAYEWCRHRELALSAGVTELGIRSLWQWQFSDVFDARQKAALAVVDVAVLQHASAGDAVHRFKTFASDREALELVVLASLYVMVATIVRTLDCDPESDDDALLDGFAPLNGTH